jgi:NADPH:quinone reductase-like Zn-dependent oxidoreductase
VSFDSDFGTSIVILEDHAYQLYPQSFPYKIGYDCAGVVAEVGSEVSRVKVGDEVYTRLPEAFRGNTNYP